MTFPIQPRPITHIIYDLDGLLLDTESINIAVSEHIATRYQRPFDPKVQSLVLGRDALASAEILVDALELPIAPADFLRQRRSLINTWKPRAEPMAGARELSEHFYKSGIKQAIATSSTQGPFQQKSAHHPDWFQIFDVVVLRDDPDVKASKPAPDSFLVAAKRLGANPTHCLVFEDSLAGVKAARTAGMSVVAVPGPHGDLSEYTDANLVLRSLLDFDPTPWSLPPFSKHFSPPVITTPNAKVKLNAS